MNKYVRFPKLDAACEIAINALNNERSIDSSDADLKNAIDYIISNIQRVRNQKMPSNFVDIKGKKFSRLTAVSTVGKDPKSGRLIWLFRCDCGAEKIASGKDVRCGSVKSCGCLSSEILMSRNVTHGKSRTPEYRAWLKMRDRCSREGSKDYKDYGGRGIKVCDEWNEDYMAFFNHMGTKPSPKHSLDRIDVNGNYEPGNVRWATGKVQGNNTRRNRFLVFNSMRKTVAEWSAETGLSLCAIHSRLDRNWDVEKTLTFPVRQIIKHDALVEFGGEAMPLSHWAKKLGIKHPALHNRIRRGWSVERALTEPVKVTK